MGRSPFRPNLGTSWSSCTVIVGLRGSFFAPRTCCTDVLTHCRHEEQVDNLRVCGVWSVHAMLQKCSLNSLTQKYTCSHTWHHVWVFNSTTYSLPAARLTPFTQYSVRRLISYLYMFENGQLQWILRSFWRGITSCMPQVCALVTVAHLLVTQMKV